MACGDGCLKFSKGLLLAQTRQVRDHAGHWLAYQADRKVGVVKLQPGCCLYWMKKNYIYATK